MLGKGMVIYMQNVNEVDFAVKPEELIARLRNGEEHLRDFMLEYYQKYILSLVSKMIGHPATSSDEYSVGLEAFNEAMDSFNHEEAASFLYFAKLVINRRVIDHIRKSKKYRAEYPFTYFEVQDREDYFENYSANHASAFTERIEIQEELLLLKRNLELYGILFEEIANCAPKHLDTKLLCLHIAKKLSTNSRTWEKIRGGKKTSDSRVASNLSSSSEDAGKPS
jgi:RNA polymerase sigma factor